jgi:hypothetical protein
MAERAATIQGTIAMFCGVKRATKTTELKQKLPMISPMIR